jgi:hypothetical protein
MPALLALLIPWASACPGSGELGDDDASTAEPTPGDDDTAADDDASGSDDDSAPADDDGSPADDDDGPPDDDDDATTPPEPSTWLEILTPSDGETISGISLFSAQIDGEDPGPAVWTIDGATVRAEFFNSTSGISDWSYDSFAAPDGEHLLAVDALDWGLHDEVTLEFLNGDLAVYQGGAPVAFDPDAAWPGSAAVEIFDSAVSLQAQVWPANGDAVDYLFGILQTPAGDWATGDATALWPIFASYPSPWAGFVPNHPYTTFDAGDWTLYPWADDDSAGVSLSSEFLVKRWTGAAEPAAGLLALDFHFVSGCGMDAAEAGSSSDFGDFLDALEAVFLQAGIALGDVRYFDVSDPALASVAGADELAALFESGGPSGDRTLHLYVVDGLDLDFGEPLGVAAHIPGPALAGGTSQGGVAVVAEYFLAGDEGTAAALVGHEAGHYLGLYHPTEVGGPAVGEDPLSDTAADCDADDCWETNLMDPYLWGSTALTADQCWVLLRHPLVQLVDPSALPARAAAPALPRPESIPPGGIAGFCATGG